MLTVLAWSLITGGAILVTLMLGALLLMGGWQREDWLVAITAALLWLACAWMQPFEIVLK